MKRNIIAALLTSAAFAACTPADDATPVEAPADPVVTPETAQTTSALETAIANSSRTADNVDRDQYRHPSGTLTFFGLEPGMTVIEINPSSYYGEILSKYGNDTGGAYIATGKPMDALADSAMYGTPSYVEFGPDSGPLAEAGSADMVLTFRNIHNWYWQDGMLDKAMGDFAAALKPGGTLGVVEHRADPREEVEMGGRPAGDAYVAKATIIAAAEKAGLVFDGESEVNANPADTKDHPFGVWTLPPNRRSSAFGQDADPDFDHSPYDAIGESDRQTLRFKKPA